MSDNILNIPFLNNVQQGKNNWWRYLITIFIVILFLLILGPLIASLIISLPLIAMGLITQSFDMNSYYQMVNSAWFNLLLTGISFSIVFLVFYICLRFLHHKKLISLITLEKVRWKKIVKGAGVWLAIILLMDLIAYAINPQALKIYFNPSKFILLLVLALILVPIQASFEEVFFRGYLLQGTSLLFKKPLLPLLITSLVFASLHFTYGIGSILNMFVIGMTLGIIVLVDNGIEMAVGVHIINNIYGNVIHTAPDAGLGSLPSLMINSSSFLSFLVMVLASVILLMILFRGRSEEIKKLFL